MNLKRTGAYGSTTRTIKILCESIDELVTLKDIDVPVATKVKNAREISNNRDNVMKFLRKMENLRENWKEVISTNHYEEMLRLFRKI